MASLSAITLRGRQLDDSEQSLPVALQQPQSNLRIVSFDPTGPGRLLHKAYVISGHHFKNALGKAAHKLGKGPAATSCRIERAFGADSVTRQFRLDSVYDSFEGIATDDERLLGEVKKDCRKLVEYALPSESLITQVQTFRTIVLLTTRYPGLRHFFVQSPKLRRVSDSSDAICALWRSKEYHYDKESDTALDFAAYCVAENDINVELERIRPSELGRVSEEGLGMVDKLVVGYCQGGSGFSRSITIRYLAGILQLPGFWGADYQLQKFTVDKLCRQTTCLIEDNNPDSLTADDFRKLGLSSDLVGIDHLAAAILAGVGAWIERKPAIPGLTSEQWLRSFIKLVQLLRELITHDLFPLASQLAKGNWETLFERIAVRVAIPSSHCEYEDVYIFIRGSQPTWSPSDIKMDAPDVQSTHVKGMASLSEFASYISRISDTAPAAEASEDTVDLMGDAPDLEDADVTGVQPISSESSRISVSGLVDDPADLPSPVITSAPLERQPSLLYADDPAPSPTLVVPPAQRRRGRSRSPLASQPHSDPAYGDVDEPGGPPAATLAGAEPYVNVGAHANIVVPDVQSAQDKGMPTLPEFASDISQVSDTAQVGESSDAVDVMGDAPDMEDDDGVTGQAGASGTEMQGDPGFPTEEASKQEMRSQSPVHTGRNRPSLSLYERLAGSVDPAPPHTGRNGLSLYERLAGSVDPAPPHTGRNGPSLYERLAGSVDPAPPHTGRNRLSLYDRLSGFVNPGDLPPPIISSPILERQPSRASTKSRKSYFKFDPSNYVDPAYWGPGGPPAATSAGAGTYVNVGAHSHKVDPTKRSREGRPSSGRSSLSATSPTESTVGIEVDQMLEQVEELRNAITVSRGRRPRADPETTTPSYSETSVSPASSISDPGNRSTSPSRHSAEMVVDSHPPASWPAPIPGPQPTTEEGVPVLFYVRALYDYSATIEEEFDFLAGDIIAVTSTPEDGWWTGEFVDETRRQKGRNVFPSNFVALF